MKSLPTEIWGEIFIHLCQDEKLECMLVCQHWNQTIKQLVLYHSIYTYSSASLKLLRNNMQKHPAIAAQVEQLVLSFSNEQCLVYLKKLLLFVSNLQTLICCGKEKKKMVLENKAQYPWHKTIEHILEDSRYGISHQLLSTSVCPRLTTLTIINCQESTIPFLVNAPALTHLSIHGLELHFDSLERIHSSLHALKTLQLTGVDFCKSDLPSESMIPATLMTECTIDLNNVELSRNRIDLLVYISKKYPNLCKLSYHIDQFIVSDDEVKPLYGIGWIPLFKKFGPQLRVLSLNNNGFENNLFTTLGGMSCSVHHLQVNFITQGALSKLTKSHHSFNSIQTLCLNNTKMDSFRWLKKLQALKKLKLYYYIHGIHIKVDRIIKNAPSSLTWLSLNNTVLVFGATFTGQTNIETISLDRVTLPKKADTMINKHFPKLSKLKLKHCDLLGQCLSLPTTQLTHFHFADNFRLGNNLVLLECDKQQRYNVQGVDYQRLSQDTCKRLHCMEYRPIKSQLVDDHNTVPDFTLICRSIENVKFSE